MALLAFLVIGLGLLGSGEQAPVTTPASSGAGSVDPAVPEAEPAETGAAPVVPAIIVEGRRPKRRIDRERYENNPTSGLQNGTIADALRRVPSVAVDAHGRIYLRGQSNVQVYIDGHPSTLMGADVRGLVLNSMPSNWVSAIELITIPNAGLANGDGGPIINLITNPNRKPGGFASGDLTTNGSDRTGISFSGSYGDSRLTVSGGLSLRDDRQGGASNARIETFDTAKSPLSLSQAESRLRTRTRTESFSGGLTFTPNALNSLSAQLMLTRSTGASESQVRDSMADGAGLTLGRYDQISRQSEDTRGQALTLNWTYTDLDSGQTLKVNLNASRSKAPARALDQFTYRAPTVRQSQTERLSANSTAMTILSLDYEHPLGEGLVTTGVSYNQTRAASTTQVTGEGVIDNGLLSNQSRDRQNISAIYGTYQQPFGDYWTLQLGLRAEDYRVGSNQEGRELVDRYLHWTPSLFVNYQPGPSAKWRFAYSREQQSASLQARNPSLIYQDNQTLYRGNPDLKAQVTDKFELAYETFTENGGTQARLFYNPTRGVVVPVTRVLTDGVIVREQENGGSGYGLGLDVSTGRQLTTRLNLQLQMGIAQNRRQTRAGEREQATAVSGQTVLSFGISDKDNLSLMYMVQGSSLTGQGKSKPFSFSSLNYTHSFSPALTLAIDIQNLLGESVTRQRYQTPTLVTTNESRGDNRIVMFTLRRSFVQFQR